MARMLFPFVCTPTGPVLSAQFVFTCWLGAVPIIPVLKKFVTLNGRSEPVSRMSSLLGHLTRLPSKFIWLAVGIPWLASKNVVPPSVVRTMVWFCEERANFCVLEMAVPPPSPNQSEAHGPADIEVVSADALSCMPLVTMNPPVPGFTEP